MQVGKFFANEPHDCGYNRNDDAPRTKAEFKASPSFADCRNLFQSSLNRASICCQRIADEILARAIASVTLHRSPFGTFANRRIFTAFQPPFSNHAASQLSFHRGLSIRLFLLPSRRPGVGKCWMVLIIAISFSLSGVARPCASFWLQPASARSAASPWRRSFVGFELCQSRQSCVVPGCSRSRSAASISGCLRLPAADSCFPWSLRRGDVFLPQSTQLPIAPFGHVAQVGNMPISTL